MRGSRAYGGKGAALVCLGLGMLAVVAVVAIRSATSQAASPAVSAKNLAEANRVVKSFSGTPAPVTSGVTTPVSHPVPRGKLIVQVTPGAPSANINDRGLELGAKLLGWKVKTFYLGTTADTFQQAFNSAVAAKPDAVWVSTVDPATWTKFAKIWNKKNIPITDQGSAKPYTRKNWYDFLTPKALGVAYKPFGDWVISDAKGKKTGVLVVNIPAIQVFKPAATYIESRIKQLCPSCATQTLNVNLANIGTTIPGQVTGVLQKNPDLKYIVFTLGDLATGVPEALKSAGVTGVKIATAAAGPGVLSELKKGSVAMDLALENAWHAMPPLDFSARHLSHSSTAPSKKWTSNVQFLYPNSKFDPNKPYSAHPTAQVLAAWKKLWTAKK